MQIIAALFTYNILSYELNTVLTDILRRSGVSLWAEKAKIIVKVILAQSTHMHSVFD
jgi:hypothetical protein